MSTILSWNALLNCNYLVWLTDGLTLMVFTRLAVLFATSLADCTNWRLATGLAVRDEATRQALQSADVCLATMVAADSTLKERKHRCASCFEDHSAVWVQHFTFIKFLHKNFWYMSTTSHFYKPCSLSVPWPSHSTPWCMHMPLNPILVKLLYSSLLPPMEPTSRGCYVSLFSPGLQASSGPIISCNH